MEFTKESQIVKSYILLIKTGERTRESVPDVFNLREVVYACLDE